MEKIIEYLQKKNSLTEPVVEKSHVVTAIEVNSNHTFVIVCVQILYWLIIQECCKLEANTTDDIINVIDIFTIPRFKYSDECKKYFRQEVDRRLLFDAAASRIQSFIDR